MERFNEVIRSLMEQREFTGVELAKEIKLSETSVSKIVSGHSKPRQVTLSRLINVLCRSPKDEQRVVGAYGRLGDEMKLSPDKRIEPTPEDEAERVTRYMEIKSMSIAFREDVERVLKDAGVSYERDFRNDPYICDFLLSLDGRQVAIECKYNVNRDWDRAITSIRLLRDGLPCDDVFIVIPYENELAREAGEKVTRGNGRILSLENLKSEASTL